MFSSDVSLITTRQAGGKQSEEIRHIHAHVWTQMCRGLAESIAVSGEERRGEKRQAGRRAG